MPVKKKKKAKRTSSKRTRYYPGRLWLRRRQSRRDRSRVEPAQAKPEKSTLVIFASWPPSYPSDIMTPDKISVGVIQSRVNNGASESYEVSGRTEKEKLVAAFKAGMRHYAKHMNAFDADVRR